MKNINRIELQREIENEIENKNFSFTNSQKSFYKKLQARHDKNKNALNKKIILENRHALLS